MLKMSNIFSFLISLLDLLQPKCNPFTRNQTIENNPPIKSTLHHKVLLCKLVPRMVPTDRLAFSFSLSFAFFFF